jgi:hypothetical protein
LPQGLLKKIQFNLLLPDLAFQLGNVFAGRIKILHPPDLRERVQPDPGRLAWPSSPPQTLSPA